MCICMYMYVQNLYDKFANVRGILYFFFYINIHKNMRTLYAYIQRMNEAVYIYLIFGLAFLHT